MPETLEITTIEPASDFSRCGSAASTVLTVCIMSTLNSFCHDSSSGVAASALTLGTTISSPPNSSATSSTHWRTAGPSPTSSARPEARTPVAPSAATAASTSASVRAQIATSEPSAASSFAIARPIPLVPPVTSDFLPFKPRSMSHPLLCGAAQGVRRSVSRPGAHEPRPHRRSLCCAIW